MYSPKLRQCDKYLQIVKVCFTLRVPNVKPFVVWPMGYSLLPVADETHMPAQQCTFSVQHNWSKQVLLMTDFVASVSQRVEIFLF